MTARWIQRTKKRNYEVLKRCRLIPSFLIFDSSVCLGMPSLVAAPVGPEISLAECVFDHFSFTLDKIRDQAEHSSGEGVEEPLVAVESAPALCKLRQTAEASLQEWMDLQRGR